MWARIKARPLDLYLLYRSLALTWAFMPFQVFYLQARGLSLASIFDLNVVFSLATVAFEVPTGIYADRNGRRVAMALGGLVMCVACALFVLGGTRFWVYALANALTALSMTLASGADRAYLYDHLADTRQSEQYARYEGLATAAKGIGNLVAVLVGGVIFSIAPAGVFVFTALLTGAAGVLALSLPEQPHPPRHASSIGEDLRRAARIVARDGRLITVLAFGAITFVLLRVSLFADQPHLETHLASLSARDLALAAALLAAAKEVGGAVVASMSGALFARVRARTLVAALGAFVVAVYWVMGRGIGALDIGLMVALGAAFGLFSPLISALMNRSIPGPRDRATLLSFESMGRRVLFAAASPLFGRAVESSSLHATFGGTAYVAAVAYALLAVGALGFFRALWGSPGRGARAGEAPRSALVSAVG